MVPRCICENAGRHSAMVRHEYCNRRDLDFNPGPTAMILPVFIIILMVGGVIAWIAERWGTSLARWISLIVLLFNLITALFLWSEQSYLIGLSQSSWIAKYSLDWIPAFGISFNLALDGL